MSWLVDGFCGFDTGRVRNGRNPYGGRFAFPSSEADIEPSEKIGVLVIDFSFSKQTGISEKEKIAFIPILKWIPFTSSTFKKLLDPS